jgi:hypothetical protein
VTLESLQPSNDIVGQAIWCFMLQVWGNHSVCQARACILMTWRTWLSYCHSRHAAACKSYWLPPAAGKPTAVCHSS